MSNECMYAWIRKSDLERCNADLERLEAENDKLRELLCELYEDQCDECDRWKYRDRMRELGIEVYK